jgi:hypothetical protein
LPLAGKRSRLCRLSWRIIATSLMDGFSVPLKGVFVSCGSITGKPDITRKRVTEGWATIYSDPVDECFGLPVVAI